MVSTNFLETLVKKKKGKTCFDVFGNRMFWRVVPKTRFRKQGAKHDFISFLIFSENDKKRCLIVSSFRCDVCVDTPPELQNFKEEADAFMQVLASHYVSVVNISISLFLGSLTSTLGNSQVLNPAFMVYYQTYENRNFSKTDGTKIISKVYLTIKREDKKAEEKKKRKRKKKQTECRVGN